MTVQVITFKEFKDLEFEHKGKLILPYQEPTDDTLGIIKDGFFRPLEFSAKAQAEGRIVVLPCKVGDMVYRKARFCDTVIDATVSQLTINKFGLQGVASKGESTRFHFDSEDIGERVFFTREAAEKALGGAES